MPAPRITAAMCARGRALAEPRLSPDGARVAFVANAGARGEIVVVPAAGGAEVVLTADPPVRPIAAYGGGAFDWARGGDSIVYAAATGGLHVVPAGGGPARAVVADGPATCPAVAPDGGRVAYVLDTHHVAVVSLDENGPWPVRLSATADFCLDPEWSPDGARVVWHEWDVPAMPWDASRVVVRAADGSGEPVVVGGGDGTCVGQPRFSPDGSALAFLSDANGWTNLWVADADGTNARPLLKEPHEHGGPTWGPGQRSYAWSPDGRQIAFCRNESGFGRLCLLDVASGEVHELAKGVHAGLSWRVDRLVAVRSGARTPTQVVAMRMGTVWAPWAARAGAGAGGRGPGSVRPLSPQPATGERTVLAVGPVAGWGAADLVEPEVVHWAGDDGGEVHGRLYRPGAPPLGLSRPPLLLFVHGGPTGQTQVTFNPRIAFFVDRGWAVLVPDHRGSTGWGRAYVQAMAGRWGELDVADCAAGLRAAAERGWCDPARMVPLGGSAGGFTVLALLARHPELCAAGVDLFGVTDLFDLDETTHRFEQHYLETIVGPLPDAAARYRERSPVNLVDRITAPLLVLQGADDNVVPPAQSLAIAERLGALGRTVELHVYDGEGHGWMRPETLQDELERTESFLRRHVLRRRGGGQP